MASGEASSVLSNSAERELPANVPPAITADKQASPRPTARTMCGIETVAVLGLRELDAIENHRPESVLAQVDRLFQQCTGLIQIGCARGRHRTKCDRRLVPVRRARIRDDFLDYLSLFKPVEIGYGLLKLTEVVPHDSGGHPHF